MIKVQRLDKPQILKSKFAAWTQKIRTARTNAEKKNAIDKYKHTEIKSTLESMFAGKCAYCEAQIDHISYGHIEHFRPKSKYPLHSLEWKNLLLACGICNGTENKGEHFPTKSQNGPIINPTIENPGNHLRFDYDEITKVAAVFSKSKRGTTTINLLGLNRKKLVQHRSRFVKKLVTIAKLSATDIEAYNLIVEAKMPDQEYCSFAKYVYRKYV